MSWDYWNVYSDTSLTVPLDKNNYDFTAGTNTASARIKNMNWGNDTIVLALCKHVTSIAYVIYSMQKFQDIVNFVNQFTR